MPDRRPASRLRVARVRAGWRLGALAAEVGMTDNCLWRIETGRTRAPRLMTRQKLAAALGVSERDLFGKVGK